MKVKTRIRTKCFVCGEPIQFERHPKIGDLLSCEYCQETVEVIKLDPLTIDWPWDVEVETENYYFEEDHLY